MLVHRRLAAVIGAVAVASVALAACGSSGDASSSGASGSGPKPVVLAVNVPTNSKPPSYPDLIAATKAAAKAINSAGGINGHPVEIRTCNDNNDPNDAAKCARKAVSDKVAAVVGSFTVYGQQVTQVLSAAGIPYVGSNGVSVAEYTCSTCYRFDAGSALVFSGLPGGLRASGATSVVPLSLDLAAAAANVAGATQAAQASGLQVKPAIKVGATSTDLAPAVAAAQQSGADAVLSVVPNEATAAFIRDADTAKATYTIGVVDGQVQDTLATYNASQAKRVLVAGAYPAIDGDTATYPGLAQYKKEMDAEVAAGDTAAKLRNSSNLRAWLSVHAVAEVAKGITGDITAQSLTTAFGTAKDVDLLGILPAWTPSKTGTIPGFPKITNAQVFFYQIVDGKLSTPAGLRGIDLVAKKPL